MTETSYIESFTFIIRIVYLTQRRLCYSDTASALHGTVSGCISYVLKHWMTLEVSYGGVHRYAKCIFAYALHLCDCTSLNHRFPNMMYILQTL